MEAISYLVYRPWPTWGTGARVGIVLFQVFVLLGMAGLALMQMEEVRHGRCHRLPDCLLRDLRLFFSEIGRG